ncbi:MAG: acyl-CoA dehydrogenase family protein [Pseudomonadales bacterium]|nr:acyl-CoA dehydrogenase family protein [Pseudomonadales bacterium]
MQTFNFDPVELPPAAATLRQEVREFLIEHNAQRSPLARAQSWSGSDPDFSRKMGERGWIGMVWPKKYGGQERTSFERYVLLEEMLVAGAPVGAHWVADRQSGPLLINFGTEAQRQKYLPPVTRGEMFYCIGMSEPDSGSDLASVRTKATKVDGGYLINGRKIWTSGAHTAHTMIALFRTRTNENNRHDGLSQFILDLREPDGTDLKEKNGIFVRPITSMLGEHHFNEVTFEDAFVPDTQLVGSEHNGWSQVMAELAFERSGPERYLSSIQLLLEMIKSLSDNPTAQGHTAIGRLVAHLITLRQMSVSVAGKLNAGEDPALEGSIVKDLGAVFEQEIPTIAQQTFGVEPTLGDGSDLEQVMGFLVQNSVSYSLRGGTREILRGIIARGLGLR